MLFKDELLVFLGTAVFLALVTAVAANASVPKEGTKHCKPAIYDALYLRLVKESLVMNIQKLDTINREGVFVEPGTTEANPDLFELFRKMCYGQHSSYEKWVGK